MIVEDRIHASRLCKRLLGRLRTAFDFGAAYLEPRPVSPRPSQALY